MASPSSCSPPELRPQPGQRVAGPGAANSAGQGLPAPSSGRPQGHVWPRRSPARCLRAPRPGHFSTKSRRRGLRGRVGEQGPSSGLPSPTLSADPHPACARAALGGSAVPERRAVGRRCSLLSPAPLVRQAGPQESTEMAALILGLCEPAAGCGRYNGCSRCFYKMKTPLSTNFWIHAVCI